MGPSGSSGGLLAVLLVKYTIASITTMARPISNIVCEGPDVPVTELLDVVLEALAPLPAGVDPIT